jgi:uncharacterized protein with PQ loop repeat
MDSVQECFGWAAACLTVCFYIGPVIPFINVLKGKLDFENSPGLFVTTCYVNCLIWYIYGEMIISDQVKISHMISALSCFILIVIYLIFELKKYLLDAILNALILTTGSWALYRAFTIVIDDDRVIGKILIVTTIVVYLAPMQIIYRVIKDKNYIMIPIYSAYVYLFACISWVIYGISINDFYLIFPHVIGTILSLIQIIIFINYKKKYPALGEKEFSSTIGIETTGNEETKKEETKIDDEPSQAKEKPVKIVSKIES